MWFGTILNLVFTVIPYNSFRYNGYLAGNHTLNWPHYEVTKKTTRLITLQWHPSKQQAQSDILSILSCILQFQESLWCFSKIFYFRIIPTLQRNFTIFYKRKRILLGGIQFTLRTDHNNLLLMKTVGEKETFHPKFQIFIEHIKRVDNIPADVFSRLVARTGLIFDNIILSHAWFSNMTLSRLNITTGFRKLWTGHCHAILRKHPRIYGQHFWNMCETSYN